MVKETYPWRRRLLWLCKNHGKAWAGKDYEYIAHPVDNHYEVYRRHSELDDWVIYKYVAIVDGIPFYSQKGIETYGEEYEKFYC